MKKFNNFFKINKSKIGKNFPTYFIADIAVITMVNYLKP